MGDRGCACVHVCAIVPVARFWVGGAALPTCPKTFTHATRGPWGACLAGGCGQLPQILWSGAPAPQPLDNTEVAEPDQDDEADDVEAIVEELCVHPKKRGARGGPLQ